MTLKESKMLDLYLNLTDSLEFLQEESDNQLKKFEESQSDEDNNRYYQLNLAISEGGKMRDALELIVNNKC